MASCAVEGGCPSDYVAIAISIVSFVVLLLWSTFPFLVHKVPRTKGSGFWIPVIQIVASFNLLLSIMMSYNILHVEKRHWWRSCYIWAVWGEGVLGFGLLLSCRITQASQLYFIFVKRRLPLIRSYFLLPLILLPWMAAAAELPFTYLFISYIFCSFPYFAGLLLLQLNQLFHFKVFLQYVHNILNFLWNFWQLLPDPPFSSPDSYVCFVSSIFLIELFIHALVINMKKPLSNRCHMRVQWIIPVVCLHSLYVATLVGVTAAVHHIEFRFDELRDLWRGILVSVACIVWWVTAYILNEIHDNISWLQISSRFLLLVLASILVLAFFSISSSQPLLSQISLRRRESREFHTMGQALGIPDSGVLAQSGPISRIDPNEPLDKLLLNKRFRQSFMAFADSCLAGESVHFFDEVHELSKIPEDDCVRRIYMARHIIDKYIAAGAAMEVNISHRIRQEILLTSNLARPDLFRNALNDIMQLMKTNLAKDYWSSMFFLKFQEDSNMRSNGYELEQITGWNFSPRLSSVHGTDDPFHEDHLLKSNDTDS